MPIKTLFGFRKCMFSSTSFVIFSSSPLVGGLGAGRTGDVVEDGGLKAAPEPGHIEE